MTRKERHNSTIGLRALIIALMIIPFNVFWVIRMERVHAGPYFSTVSLFANVIFILTLLVFLNGIIRRLRKSWALTQAELLVVYTMIAISTAMAGLDYLPNLLTMMPHYVWFATPENRWDELFGGGMPGWLTVNDRQAVVGFFEGNSSLYVNNHWQVWIKPLMWWSAFIFALGLIMVSIGILVRNLWVERERLPYPIIELPLQMTAPRSPLWRNSLFWLGVVIALSIDLVNGLARFYPNVPTINIRPHDLAAGLTSKPWNAIDWLPVSLYPFVIGLGYLLPVDLLFSCWFFYLFFKAQLVMSSALGLDGIPAFPFVREQNYGAYIAIVAILVFNGRHYIREVVNRALGRESELDDSREGMSYRVAFILIILSSIFLLGFLKAMGMSLWLAVLALVMYFIMSVVIMRIRAELGPPVHDQHFSGPDTILVQAIGSSHLSKTDLATLNFFYFFNRAYRCHPMPIVAEGHKLAHTTGSSQRAFTVYTLIAMVVGMFVTFWAFLHLAYIYGLTAKFSFGYVMGGEAFNRLTNWTANPAEPNIGANLAIMVGFMTALGLGVVRSQVFAFPFHPIGFAISGSWSMNLIWFPLFVSWFIKLSILRYGGLQRYRFFMPFFLGLVMGQCLMVSIWSLIGMVLDVRVSQGWLF